VNQLPKSPVREIRTPGSVGTGGGRPPPVTRWAVSNHRPYRDPERLQQIGIGVPSRRPCRGLTPGGPDAKSVEGRGASGGNPVPSQESWPSVDGIGWGLGGGLQSLVRAVGRMEPRA
jgi:hypothetical protein